MELQNFNKIENEFLKRREPIITTLINILKKANSNLLVLRDVICNKLKKNNLKLSKDNDWGFLIDSKKKLEVWDYEKDGWFIEESVIIKEILCWNIGFSLLDGYYFSFWDYKKDFYVFNDLKNLKELYDKLDSSLNSFNFDLKFYFDNENNNYEKEDKRYIYFRNNEERFIMIKFNSFNIPNNIEDILQLLSNSIYEFIQKHFMEENK